MPENENSTPSPPEKRKTNGQFQKGLCPNPKGRGKGNLAKKTKFLQVLTSGRQTKALRVLDKVLQQAESGDTDSQKMVLTLLQPFVKREVEQGGGTKDKRPLININVGVTDGKKPVVTPRIIDGKSGAVDG